MSACYRLDLESLGSLTNYAQKHSFPNTVTKINARVSTSGHKHPNDAQVFVCFPRFRNEVEMAHGELCNCLVRRVGNGGVEVQGIIWRLSTVSYSLSIMGNCNLINNKG